jgi:hypothetical protein
LAGNWTGADDAGDSYTWTISSSGQVSGNVSISGSPATTTGTLTANGSNVSGSVSWAGQTFSASGTLNGTKMKITFTSSGFTTTANLTKQ